MTIPRRDSGRHGTKTGPIARKTATVTATGGAAPPPPVARPVNANPASPPGPSPATSTDSGIAVRATGTHRVVAGGSQVTRGTAGNQRSSGALSVPRPTRGGTQAASDRRGTPNANGPRRAASHLNLRAKFMLVLSGTTAAVMILLGMIMSISANKYLGGQKRHDGVEIARLAAQVISASVESFQGMSFADQTAINYAQIRERLRSGLEEARTWGTLGSDPSDILAVKFNLPEKHSQLSSSGFGTDEQSGAEITERFNDLFIPKSGTTVTLPNGIQIYTVLRRAEGVVTPIYRFKVELDHALFGGRPPDGVDWSQTPYVNVDINASAVTNAQGNLMFAIFLAVVISIGITIGVANWLAANITRPVQLLVKDMKIVAQGNLDHETRPHSDDEIGILATEFNRMTNNLKSAQSALVEQEKAEYELSIAREVQRQLLPANPPDIPGFQCASYYLGAKAVSGDYFDFIDLGDGLWGFIIADVSGKGIPGSMVMAVTRTIVRLIAVQHGADAHETLKQTNRLIARQIKRGMFVTSFYAVLDSRSGRLSYACAGHNPMVIYRGARRTHELAAGKGIALGFNEGPIFDKTIELHQTTLDRGDGIVLYTDGFPEAMNARNEEFGDDRFYELVPKYSQGDVQNLINGLVGEIAKHRGDAEQSDDLTLLAVRRL